MNKFAIEYLNPLDLIDYDKNAKTHPQSQIDKLAREISDVGFRQPIVIDSNGIICSGHGRKKAAIQLGLAKVPVHRLPKDMAPERVRAMRLFDNKIAESLFDTELLKLELTELSKFEDFDFSLTGFDDDFLLDAPKEFEQIESEDTGEPAEEQAPEPEPFVGKTDDDEVPEVEEVPTSKLGQVWQLGRHRLKCGDATSETDIAHLMDGKKADMVFTDPPYGVSFVGVKGSMYRDGERKGSNSTEQIKNDDLRGDDLTGLFHNALTLAVANVKATAALYIFFAINRSVETLPAVSENGLVVRNWLIWDKGNVGYHAMNAQYKPNYEAFLYCHLKGHSPSWKGSQQQQTIWRHSSERLGLHPTMKPVALIEQAIMNHSTELVLDLFGGSGSTLIACEKTGRICHMMELDEKYCDVIIKRWEKYTDLKAELVS